MLISGDDIQKLRQQAIADSENPGSFGSDDTQQHLANAVLALFICAEQLYEIRANLGILIDRKERQ